LTQSGQPVRKKSTFCSVFTRDLTENLRDDQTEPLPLTRLMPQDLLILPTPTDLSVAAASHCSEPAPTNVFCHYRRPRWTNSLTSVVRYFNDCDSSRWLEVGGHGIHRVKTSFRRVFERLTRSNSKTALNDGWSNWWMNWGFKWLQWMAKVPMAPMTANRQSKPLHLVSASEHRLVLCKRKAENRMRSPRFPHFSGVAWPGRVVMSHSMRWGLKKAIAHQIHTAGADYILSLKSNHPRCFNRWNSGFSNAGGWPLPTHVNTPLSLHIDTRTVWDTLGGPRLLPSLSSTQDLRKDTQI